MATPTTEHIAEVLLNRAHSTENSKTIFREKVRLRPLLLRPTSPDPNINARSKRQYDRLQKAKEQRKSKKPKPLSAKQKRALCIYEIPKEQRKYDIYAPLHVMWCSYMREVLGISEQRSFVDPVGAGPMLTSADYHGAMLEVVRSRCVSRVGLQGIVVKDNKFSFELITRKNELKTVPKEHTVFRFEVPFEVKEGMEQTSRDPLSFEIYGSQFEARAPDRATKKFRLHFDPSI
ncbi:RNase P/MRP, p29 subunit [Dissoconium aciculare CBS 342.82]|uniref:Ribonuclease P protein subunit n=1 Tax=Dissoconium aciculare CBS 342.82 TaxID=1314786 RepID=A0A6J3M8R8_9PEZI|nr:RNase P/MRP, p29 subunit [Dissoconium aciculare CBS 342.82]KAF1823994.1 RNase P/MRP, p29 subunit [Dissoconium aciculare CBS 342.82]